MPNLKYRATLRMLCHEHGNHEVRMYSTNDCLAALTADREALALAELGHPTAVTFEIREDGGEWESVTLDEAVARDLEEQTL